MSGLEVISVIANIIQLVEFSEKVLARAAELHASGKDVGEALLGINDMLPPISLAVQKTKKRIDSKEIDEETAKALLPIHRGVERTLVELKTILDKYTPGADASRVEVFWKATRSVWQEKKVKGVQARLHEYVGVLTLSHAEAAAAGNLSSAEKAKIQQILANVSRSNAVQAAFLPSKGRNLLSLDGGGLRGLSILYVLQDLMARINQNQDPPLKPCEVFDLIGGSGTGGLIAIMLGRLGMTVEECLNEYLDLFESLSVTSSGNPKAAAGADTVIKLRVLEAAMTKLVKKRGLEADAKLMNENNTTCYTFVCATAETSNSVVTFQNYLLSEKSNQTPVTIVDATCATLSSTNVFEAVELGEPPARYVAGDLGANNPIHSVWKEAERIWGKTDEIYQVVSCVTSIGAGLFQVPSINQGGVDAVDAVDNIATQTEETSKNFVLGKQQLMGHVKRYYRFNVSNRHIAGLEQPCNAEGIKTDAQKYLEGQTLELEMCAEHLKREVSGQGSAREFLQDPMYRDIPRKLVRNFIGRKDILSKIRLYFSRTDVFSPRVMILHALGGQGKSQIALKYCDSLKETHQGIFWVNASSEITTTAAFEGFASMLDQQFSSTLNDSEQRIKFVLDTLERWSTRWILVFDNYDTPEAFKVQRFFPRSKTGEILITSRNQNLGRLGELLEIPAMSSREGLELLITDSVQREANESEGLQIVDRLGGHALAIDQAAAYMTDMDMDIEEFLPKLDAESKKILEYTPDYGWEYSTMQLDGKAEKDKALSAFTTWNLSFQRLFPQDPKKQQYALHFLTVYAFLDYLNIEEDLIRIYWEQMDVPFPEWLRLFIKVVEDSKDGGLTVEDPNQLSSDNMEVPGETKSQKEDAGSRKKMTHIGSRLRTMLRKTPSPLRMSLSRIRSPLPPSYEWVPEQFSDLMAKCRQLSLIRIQSDDRVSGGGGKRTFAFHPLIRDWLQFRVQEAQRLVYFKEVIDIIKKSANLFLHVDTTSAQKASLLSHIDACVANDVRFSRREESLKCIDLESAHSFGYTYLRYGRWEEAEKLVLKIVHVSKDTLGKEDPRTLRYMDTQSRIQGELGRNEEAENRHLQVLATREKVLGPDHPDTLISMHNLALVYWYQKRYDEAEKLQLKVLEKTKTLLGSDHENLILIMNNLGSTYSDLGRHEEAEDMHFQAMNLSQKVLSLDHPSTLLNMSNLAIDYTRQGRYKEAEELQLKVLERRRKVLGPNHPFTLQTMSEVAIAYRWQNKFAEATPLLLSALEMMRVTIGVNHRITQMYEEIYKEWEEADSEDKKAEE